MFKKKKMIVTLDRDGVVVKKEISTFRSPLGLLKTLKRQARYSDPYARFLTLKGVITLVIHTPYLDFVTVHPVDPSVEDNTLEPEEK